MRVKTILVIGLLFLIPVWEMEKESIIKLEKKIEEKNEISHQNLYNSIVESGIKFPEIVFVQAIIESGNFESRLFKNHNNLFGMRFPRVRETTATGENKRGYARYKDWDDSVLDYYFWQNFFLRKKGASNRDEYLDLLDEVYAEDESYVSVIRTNLKKYRHIFNN